jgi:hypothetical protein
MSAQPLAAIGAIERWLGQEHVAPGHRRRWLAQQADSQVAAPIIRCGCASYIARHERHWQPSPTRLQELNGLFGFGTIVQYQLGHRDHEKSAFVVANERGLERHG